MIRAIDLRCNHTRDPLGVDTPQPQFSWRTSGLVGTSGSCSAKHPGQSAYRLVAAATAENLHREAELLWDSGRVESADSLGIRWGGPPLRSATKYCWKVCLWDAEGQPGPWSAAVFETGLLHPEDWHARWIAPGRPAIPAPPAEGEAAPLLRCAFTLAADPVSARAYVCGLGYYELYVNGQKVGDEFMNPPFTAFDKTCLYRTLDIAPLLRRGDNVIAAMLGNGMYNVAHVNAWDFEKAPWRHHPKLLAQAHVALADGTGVQVLTGTHWKSSSGPITFNSLYVGEAYDARLEQPGWNAPGFDDSAWQAAVLCRSPGGVLKSMQMQPIRIVEEFQPKSFSQVCPGVWVYDMGRNIAGWARLKVSGPASTTVGLKYTELLTPDGDVDDTNIRAHVRCESIQHDHYTLKGERVEVYEPRFTYHGFQYVRLTGYPGEPTLDTLTACVAHTDLPSAGGFACSNDLINRIHAAARASTENNYHGMPTDCPHREKNGWTGDALLSSEQVLLNYDPRTAYGKWLDDILDSQRPNGALPGIVPTGGWGFNWGSGPMWDSLLVWLPWNLYVYTGDREPLERCWGGIRRYIAFMDGMSEDGTLDFGLGDWCPANRNADDPKTPTRVSDTWFYLADCVLAGKIAAALGDAQAAGEYQAKAENLRQVFRRRFIDEGTGAVTGDCMTSYALALHWDIAQGELAQKILSRLVAEVERYDRHFDCGMLGTKTVLQALADHGRADLAYALAAQDTYPSFGEWIIKGATTLWEMWRGEASLDHHMFSDVSAFFYKTLAGIRPDEAAPGFRHTWLAPRPVEGLEHAQAWHETPYGMLRCGWRKESDSLVLDIEVPGGTTATLSLPAPWATVSVNGGEAVALADGVRLEAGVYHILAR